MAPGPGNWFDQYVKGFNPTYKPPAPTQPWGGGGWQNLLTRPAGYNYEDYVAQQDAAARAAQMGSGGLNSPYLQQLLQQLTQNAQMGSPTLGAQQLAEIARTAQKQASSQYDPQIEAIRREMGITKGRAKSNSKELKALYGGLANSYAGDVEASRKSYAAYGKQEKQDLKELQGMLGKDYGKALAAQNKEFSDLGISAASAEAGSQQREDLDYLQKLSAVESQSQQNALSQMGAGEETYYREGRGIAGLEGNNAVSDVMSQLNDYLTQRSGDITGLEGQRAAAVEQLKSQLQGQAQQQLQQAQQENWDRFYKLAGLYNTIAGSGGQGPKQYTRGLLGANQLLGDQLGATRGGQVAGTLQELLGQQPFREGRVKSGNDYIKMTPEQAASYAASYADQQGLSSTDKLALVQAVLAYYGRMGG